MHHTFKIKAHKFVEETKDSYAFANSKRTMKNRFDIPKNQVIKFEIKKQRNTHSNKLITWAEVTITDWIWNNMKLEKRFNRWKFVVPIATPR